jgi:hypothetical protein
VNQPVVLLVAIERLGIWKKELATVGAWTQKFGATERSPSMYIRMRVLPWSNTFVSVGQVGINFSFEPASRFTSAIERSGIWKKEDSNGLGTVWCD